MPNDSILATNNAPVCEERAVVEREVLPLVQHHLHRGAGAVLDAHRPAVVEAVGDAVGRVQDVANFHRGQRHVGRAPLDARL